MADERRLLAVHPHPDDESIACGGILSRYAAAGAGVHVVTCTGGEAGENLAGIDLGGRSLAEVRRDEMAAAVEALGLTSHRYLGFRDSGMAGTPENDHPDAFVNADLDVAATRLAGIIRELRPHVVVSDDERGTYGHPDHIQAHHVARRAMELAGDAEADLEGAPWRPLRHVAFTFDRDRLFRLHRRMLEADLPSPFGGEDADREALAFGVEPSEVAFVVDVGDWLDRKQDGMRAHASQVAADSFFLNFPIEVARDAFGVEEFILVSGAAPRSAPSHDLFEGLT